MVIINRGIDQVMTLVRAANTLFQMMEPWKLKKDGQLDKMNATMAATMETARVVGILLQPVVPSFSDRLLGKSPQRILRATRDRLRNVSPLCSQTRRASARAQLGLCTCPVDGRRSTAGHARGRSLPAHQAGMNSSVRWKRSRCYRPSNRFPSFVFPSPADQIKSC